ncbi:C6 transcription factor [Aspergillus costaricaensis CBS 115574]|uniref:C6 transcription factor n=1 Tax=Aspergillus costaricaensis CBS 115574 TaxID=1448317 RepID=A0ACD1IBH4_9EURO|nr:C6 transcription factor [Aspergillus costaricaensis CBS 115574]RAK87882.1 C6 transcription factor [Aspergillus costaricaensis CBS 115574]
MVQRPSTQTPTRRRCRREGAKWTRSGCLTCKRRRKRCDEAKPCCHSCARLGLKCEGYGSMWAEPLDPSANVFSQFRAPKRRRVSTTSASTTCSRVPEEELWLSPSSPVSSNLSTAPTTPAESDNNSLYSWNNEDNEYGDKQVTIPDIDSCYTFTVASPMPSRYFSHLSHHDTHYLQYHTELGSKLLANLESIDNPLRSFLIPRALSSPLLMKALCAVSATHFANRSRDKEEAQTAATDYYVQTLSGLQSTIAKYSARTLPDEAILAVAMLCKYEIVRGSVQQWTAHLNALQELIVARGGVNALKDDMREFLSGFYIYAYNMARISNRKHINYDLDIGNVKISKLDIYIGYAEDLIKICARIADLPTLSLDPVALDLEVHLIDTSLRDWAPTNTEYILPRGITESNLIRLRMVANCFRDAAYIYLHSTLERLNQRTAAPLSPQFAAPLQLTLHTPFKPVPSPSISLPRSTALHQLLSRIREFPLDEHCEFSALTFPLFIAGCESKHPSDQELIIHSLDKLEANFGIGNVRRAKEMLSILWAGEGDVHWLDMLERLQWDLILA